MTKEQFITLSDVPTVSVYEAFTSWLENIGIRRNYTANLKSINKHILNNVTGLKDYFQYLYTTSGCTDNMPHLQLILFMIDQEIEAGVYHTGLTRRYLEDCKSAVRRFRWFLNSNLMVMPEATMSVISKSTQDGIDWYGAPRKELGADFRLKTQDRVNNQDDKPTNFPIRIIDQIANNAADWADKFNLPQNHVARKVKQAKDKWVEDSVNDAMFLIDGSRFVRLKDVERIGTKRMESGVKTVYIQIKDTYDIHQVMTRKAEGEIAPMYLGANESLTAIALDHVYRMEDLLNDLGGSFPFLTKITEIIRKNKVGNIRGTKTRQAVIEEISRNFNKYADDMGVLISDLNKIRNIVTLEAIHKKDNLDKH